MERPIARCEDVLTETVGDELVVFDARSNRAHALDAQAAAVWRACDGQRSGADIAERCALDELAVEHTLAQLRACDLLESASEDATTVSRRTVLRRLALTGAGVGVGLPAIASIVVPSAAAAASLNLGLGGGSTPPSSGGVGVTTTEATTTTQAIETPGVVTAQTATTTTTSGKIGVKASPPTKTKKVVAKKKKVVAKKKKKKGDAVEPRIPRFTG